MSGNFRKWLSGGIFAAWLPWAMAAVPAAWEQFPSRTNADAWAVYDFGDGIYYFPSWVSTAGQQHIWFYHDDDEPLEFSVNSLAGGGALVGDYAAANVDSVTVDLFIEDLDEFEKVDCAIFTKGPDGVERWYYSVPYTWADFTADGWQRFVRFGLEETWSYFNGSQNVVVVPDQTFLSSVKSVAITFFPIEGSTLDMRVGIDNFVLEPKVVAPALVTGTTATQFRIAFTPARGLSADLQKMALITPFGWTDVSGQTFITGPAEHVFTTPLDEPTKIFRVKVFPDYIPVVTN